MMANAFERVPDSSYKQKWTCYTSLFIEVSNFFKFESILNLTLLAKKASNNIYLYQNVSKVNCDIQPINCGNFFFQNSRMDYLPMLIWGKKQQMRKYAK